MAANSNTNEPRSPGWFPVLMVVLIGATRLLPYVGLAYPWNFAPVGAMSLYGGARLRFWQALTLPLLLMVVTDSLIWWLTGYKPFDGWVYGSFLVSVLLGRLLVRTNSPWRIGAVTVLASAQFFVVTNFGVWWASSVEPATLPDGVAMVRVNDPMYRDGRLQYARNAQGLATCYLMGARFMPEKGIPFGFALPALLSDLLFSALLFGAHYGVSWRVGRRVPALTAMGGTS